MRSWTMSPKVTVETSPNPSYKRIAAKALEMNKNNASVYAIAIALSCDSRTIAEAIRWAAAYAGGDVPHGDTGFSRKQITGKVNESGAVVVRMRDEEGKSFAAIRRELNLHACRVSTVYKQFHYRAYVATLNKDKIRFGT